MRDGRFNVYGPGFKEHFIKYGKIIFGPDYRDSFIFELPKQEGQNNLRYSLRACRQDLMLSHYYKNKNYTKFLERFKQSIDAVANAPTQILFMMATNNFEKERFEAANLLRNIFPIDMTPLEKIKELYQNPRDFYKIYKNSEEVYAIWNLGLTFLEELIKHYLLKYPR